MKDFASLAEAFGVEKFVVADYCDCNSGTKGKRVFRTASEAYEAKLELDAADKRKGFDFVNAYYYCATCNGFTLGRLYNAEPADLVKLNKLTDAPEAYGLN